MNTHDDIQIHTKTTRNFKSVLYQYFMKTTFLTLEEMGMGAFVGVPEVSVTSGAASSASYRNSSREGRKNPGAGSEHRRPIMFDKQ